MLYDFAARMHEDDIVYIHQRAQRAGIALKTKYSPLVDIIQKSKRDLKHKISIEIFYLDLGKLKDFLAHLKM